LRKVGPAPPRLGRELEDPSLPAEVLEEAADDALVEVEVWVDEPLDDVDLVLDLEGVPLLPVANADVLERRHDVGREFEGRVLAALPKRDLERLEVLELSKRIRERRAERREAGIVVRDEVVGHVLREEGEDEVGEVLGEGQEDRRHVVVQVCERVRVSASRARLSRSCRRTRRGETREEGRGKGRRGRTRWLPVQLAHIRLDVLGRVEVNRLGPALVVDEDERAVQERAKDPCEPAAGRRHRAELVSALAHVARR